VKTSKSIAALLLALLISACNGLNAKPAPETDAQRKQAIDDLYQSYRSNFPDVNEVTPQGLLDLEANGDTILVDVRTPAEQAVSMLPGAITQSAFAAARDLYRDKTVVTYCTIGARSGEYAEELRGEGIEVFNLKGSILAWSHAGLPLVDREGHDTKKVHTYGQKWDLVADGYEGVWD